MSLCYEPGELTGTFKLLDWGWPAYLNYCKEVQEGLPRTFFFDNFKLSLLAYCNDIDLRATRSDQSYQKLPKGLSREVLIADMLRVTYRFGVENVMNNFGKLDRKKDIKVCVTIPAIYPEKIKHIMTRCSQMGGLVEGPYCRDEDNFVLESEAGSVYCLQKLKGSHDLRKGSKVLVVDAGGGTADLVVHELLHDSGLRVKQVTTSTRERCTFVDSAFMEFFAGYIDCFQKLKEEQPASILTIQREWEGFKYGFSGQEGYTLNLSAKIGDAWQKHHIENNTWSNMTNYSEVVITSDDTKSFFDPR